MKRILFILICLMPLIGYSQIFTRQDTMRGSNGRGRDWWHVIHYDLTIQFDTAKKSIVGKNIILFQINNLPKDSMQIDLQSPLVLDSAVLNGNKLHVVKEGNVWWVKNSFSSLIANNNCAITVYFHGTPRKAINPPWDGGFSWKKDGNDKLWLAVSCQGLGASSWWACKDAQWEEPDSGININFLIPKGLQCVSNGRLKAVNNPNPIENEWQWQVKNPINSYDVTFYIGDYIHWTDTLNGEKGKLDLDFWVLRSNEEKARKQFQVVKSMLHCYEYWLGPYPFYEDGYKLVESPYLGMEHQSAIAYGNNYKMGYLGSDRGTSGIGKNFDYIIVHESGHEWFGNNITAKDEADNWIHEGFTTFAECLFVECQMGKEAGENYEKGSWVNIMNNRPIIGHYGVNEEGSNDMYDKGAAILWMVRKWMNDDDKFRNMLRNLGKIYYHKTTNTQEIEDYIIKTSKLNLAPFFNQYLRTNKVPELQYYIKNNMYFYKFNNTVPGFTVPITFVSLKKNMVIHPTGEWQNTKWKEGFNIKFMDDFLFTVK